MNSLFSKVRLGTIVSIFVILVIVLLLWWTDSPFAPQDTSAYPAPQQAPSASGVDVAYPVNSIPNSTPTPSQSNAAINSNNLDQKSYLPITFHDWALGSPKKGLAWGFAGTYPDDYLPFHVRWYHDWGTSGPVDNQYMEFVPFIWCDFGPRSPLDTQNNHNFNLIKLAVQDLGNDYDGYLLIFNEPNFFNSNNPQCDKHPDEAAQIYVQIRTAFPDAKIVGPNLSEGGGYSAINYVNLWREEVLELTGQYPELAGYGVHSYRGNHADTLDFLSIFYQAMQSWGDGDKELWLTEFGYCEEFGVGHEQQIAELVNSLESTEYDFVSRYAYYTTRQKRVIEPGDPTPTPASWEICNSDLYERFTFDLSPYFCAK